MYVHMWFIRRLINKKPGQRREQMYLVVYNTGSTKKAENKDVIIKILKYCKPYLR